MSLRRLILLLTLAAGLAAVPGCQSQSVGTAPRATPRYEQPPRSLALPSPALHWLSQQGPSEPGLPWYVDRRDGELGVTVGFRSATRLRTVTLTTDRQRLTHGRAIDHYYSTTYRERVTEEIR